MLNDPRDQGSELKNRQEELVVAEAAEFEILFSPRQADLGWSPKLGVRGLLEEEVDCHGVRWVVEEEGAESVVDAKAVAGWVDWHGRPQLMLVVVVEVLVMMMAAVSSGPPWIQVEAAEAECMRRMLSVQSLTR